MTLYQFHVRTDAQLVRDTERLDFPDLPSALQEALRSADEFRAEAAAGYPMRIEIADATGRIVLMVPVHDMVVDVPD